MSRPLSFIYLCLPEQIKIDTDGMCTIPGSTPLPAGPLWRHDMCWLPSSIRPSVSPSTVRGVNKVQRSLLSTVTLYWQYLWCNVKIVVVDRPFYGKHDCGTVCLWQWRYSCYGRPLSVSGRPCYILPMFFYYFFYGRLILRPWWTEVRESFTCGGPWVSLKKLLLGFFSGHP